MLDSSSSTDCTNTYGSVVLTSETNDITSASVSASPSASPSAGSSSASGTTSSAEPIYLSLTEDSQLGSQAYATSLDPDLSNGDGHNTETSTQNATVDVTYKADLSSEATESSRRSETSSAISSTQVYRLPLHPLRQVEPMATVKPLANAVQPAIYPHPVATSSYYTRSVPEEPSPSYGYGETPSHHHQRGHGHSHGHGHKQRHGTESSASTYIFPSDEAEVISTAMGYRNKVAYISAVRANLAVTSAHS
ncbi:hypothetical protein LPJ75_000530 [Coemansia sp. RSA 2598]|nr:hypothetical protein LPJ75_000530 [Coemansia sp. RSA 2598]